MPKDNQKKANIAPKSDDVKESSPTAKDSHMAKENEETTASSTVVDEAKKADAKPLKDEPKPSEKKAEETPMKKAEDKIAKAPKVSSEKKPSASKLAFLWPVICSAVTAGALITTQDMWMRTTSMTNTKDFSFQQEEMANLKEQIGLLENQLKNLSVSENPEQPLESVEKSPEVEEVAQELIEETAKTDENADAAQAIAENEKSGAEVTAAQTDESYGGENLADVSSQKDAIAEDGPTDSPIVEEGITSENSPKEEPSITQVEQAAEDIAEPLAENNMVSVEALETQITALTEKVDELQNSQLNKGEYAGIISQLQANQLNKDEYAETINKLQEAQLNKEEYEARLNALETQLSDVEGQMEQVKADILEISAHPEAELASQYMTLDNLASRIQTGENYKDALDAFEAVMPSSSKLETLRQNEAGVAPLHRLITEFKPVSRDILIAERKAEAEEAGSSQKILSSFNELVTISRKDGGKEGSADRLVYDIEQALKNGDFSIVINLLEGRSDETQAVAKNWLDKVKIRDEISKNLLQLRDDLANQPKGE